MTEFVLLNALEVSHQFFKLDSRIWRPLSRRACERVNKISGRIDLIEVLTICYEQYTSKWTGTTVMGVLLHIR